MKASEAREIAQKFRFVDKVMTEILEDIRTVAEFGKYEYVADGLLGEIHDIYYDIFWKPKLESLGYEVSDNGNDVLIKW